MSELVDKRSLVCNGRVLEHGFSKQSSPIERGESKLGNGRQQVCRTESSTTMQHRSCLPPEMLDYIVDFLHDNPGALKQCCLISQSWISRTRRHLFFDVKFRSALTLELWKQTFPDTARSPAYHTHTLLVCCPEVVTIEDAGEGGWIRGFFRVVHLGVHTNPAHSSTLEVSLAPFHSFSPALKYLRVLSSSLLNSQIFGLISTLPHLEDLTLSIGGFTGDDAFYSDATLDPVRPSPAFAGTLDLTVFRGMGSTVLWLLGLPNGVQFRNLALSWLHEADLHWINALVVGCVNTLQRLSVACHLRRRFELFTRLSRC
jgi:hypothetical protein